jgi:hypothetical protein
VYNEREYAGENKANGIANNILKGIAIANVKVNAIAYVTGSRVLLRTSFFRIQYNYMLFILSLINQNDFDIKQTFLIPHSELML